MTDAPWSEKRLISLPDHVYYPARSTGQSGTHSPPPQPQSAQCYLTMLDNTVAQLDQLAEGTEAAVSEAPSEEIAGMLRATAGKARLLVTKKLNQFRGLCNQHMEADPDIRPTTIEDLAGFWDLVNIQVEEVLLQFEAADKLRKNNWRTPQEDEQRASRREIARQKNNARIESRNSSLSKNRNCRDDNKVSFFEEAKTDVDNGLHKESIASEMKIKQLETVTNAPQNVMDKVTHNEVKHISDIETTKLTKTSDQKNDKGMNNDVIEEKSNSPVEVRRIETKINTLNDPQFNSNEKNCPLKSKKSGESMVNKMPANEFKNDRCIDTTITTHNATSSHVNEKTGIPNEFVHSPKSHCETSCQGSEIKKNTASNDNAGKEN